MIKLVDPSQIPYVVPGGNCRVVPVESKELELQRPCVSRISKERQDFEPTKNNIIFTVSHPFLV
jgi:hypothetical protein